MAYLFSDENFSFRIIAELRRLGHDVGTTRDAGLANMGTSDLDILLFATGEGRATMTMTMNHRDFVRLHGAFPRHGGIISCTDDPDRVRLAQRIHSAISVHATLAGLLIRVTRPGPSKESA